MVRTLTMDGKINYFEIIELKNPEKRDQIADILKYINVLTKIL